MDERAIYEQLTLIFHEVFDRDDILVVPQMVAADVEGWDSLAHIRLIVGIEEAFQIGFTAAESSRFENVGQVVASIRAKISGSAAMMSR
jgi:acyl carrier protein